MFRGKGIPKGKVITLHGTSAIRVKTDVTSELKDIFYNKKHGEYTGGTLSFTDCNGNFALRIVNRGMNEEENFWIAMNYIKYKSKHTNHYEEALKLIMSREDMAVDVSKMLLVKV